MDTFFYSVGRYAPKALSLGGNVIKLGNFCVGCVGAGLDPPEILRPHSQIFGCKMFLFFDFTIYFSAFCIERFGRVKTLPYEGIPMVGLTLMTLAARGAFLSHISPPYKSLSIINYHLII